jgi:hypothetical protein
LLGGRREAVDGRDRPGKLSATDRYSDGTLRINSRCLAVTAPEAERFRSDHQCRDRHRAELSRGSIADGTPLVMGPDLGDQSSPWHVSFRHYMGSR